MGIIDRVVGADKAYRPDKRLRDLIDSLEKTQSTDSFVDYLSYVLRSPNATSIEPFEMFVNVVDLILDNKVDFNDKNYYSILKKAEDIYSCVFDYESKTENFEALSLMYYDYFKTNGVIANNLFDPKLYDLFLDKKCYDNFTKSFLDNVDAYKTYFVSLVGYAIEVRGYFHDETAFSAHLIKVVSRMAKTCNVKLVVEEELRKVEHMAGIYEIDEIVINKAEEQMITARNMLHEAQSILASADSKMAALKQLVSSSSDTIEQICNREIANVDSFAKNARQDLNRTFDEFIDSQKKIVLFEKDVLSAQLVRDSEEKLNEIQRMAHTITGTASAELAKLNMESDEIVRRMQSLVREDEDLKKVLSSAQANKEFIEKIRKIQILNDNNLDFIEANIKQARDAACLSQAPYSEKTVVEAKAQPETALDDDNEIPAVNPLLDQSIPFRNRLDMIMRAKEQMISQGEHFHEMFDDVLIALLENVNPYLIGPSGCGKTYMVGQLAKLLNMEFIDIGYINEEYDILGFQTANGGYSRPNFYRCYKYGKIAFCDELDNGNSRATVKLNSFLVNTENAAYNFPNGEHVKRHENFRIIAAGNTAGNGADANYNTREKIEESVQQRLTPVYVGYDNAVEEKIMGEYTDWYHFIVLFRLATDTWEKKNFMSAPGILTTRDAAKIKRYLDNRSFCTEQIIKYEFVQTKDVEYLTFLESVMHEHLAEYEDAAPLMDEFSKQVKEAREKGIRG